MDDWTRLDRFLILGAEGGTYYITERDLVKQNHDTLVRCIKADGIRAVNCIVEISDRGRAPKNDPAIFALALVLTHGDVQAAAGAAIGAAGEAAVKLEELLDKAATLLDVHEARLERLEQDVGIDPNEEIDAG